MSNRNYIDEKMKEFAMNIAEFTRGQIIIDSDNCFCEIQDKTMNSIQVSIKRKSKKGSDSQQWFDMKEFNKRFKIIERNIKQNCTPDSLLK